MGNYILNRVARLEKSRISAHTSEYYQPSSTPTSHIIFSNYQVKKTKNQQQEVIS
jgi:hypothetical protein